MARCPHCGRPTRRVWQPGGKRLHEHENGEICSDRKRRPGALSAERLAAIRTLAAKPLLADRAVQQVQVAALELLKHLRGLREFRLDVGWYTVVWIGRGLEMDEKTRECVATQRALQRDYGKVERVVEEVDTLLSSWPERRAARVVSELRSLIAWAWPRLTLPSLPPTPSYDGGLTLDELQKLAPEMKALRSKPCPHCSRAVKDVGFRLSGRDYHYVFVHPDRRLCGGDEPRIFLRPDELASLEEQAGALRNAQEAARFARSWLGGLVDEVADLESAVDEALRESVAWRQQMFGAMASYARWGARLPRGELKRATEVRRRLRRMARWLGQLAAAAPPRGEVRRKRMVEIQGSLAELVTVFDGWRKAMGARKGRGRQRRSLRLAAG